MANAGAATAGSRKSIAVVGLGCRFPDATGPAALLDLVLAGRRAFRRIPPCRVDLADYYSAVPATPDATYSTRAALIEGWRFDRAAFGVPGETFVAADPAHWLTLETAAAALAAAGFPAGTGLPRDRTAVIIGNTLGGDVSRASALRLRWPYVRQVLAEAVHAEGLPADQASRVLRRAAARYLAPFPAVTSMTLAGSSPAAFAAGIGAYFRFRGGSFALDGGSASSLLAVANGCAALAAGDIDVAVAGGVDIGLDPLALVGMAKAGLLATVDMRVYDENPTGFLPGEGCGIVLLMRSADAVAAGCQIHAHIAGWGTAEAGQLGRLSQLTADSGSHLLALRRAYHRAGVDPADVALIEGTGTGVAAADEAELVALAELRAGTPNQAAIGSVTASLGHSRAAAGAAGLIKTVLAVRDGVVPPAVGVRTPHPIARDGGAGLRFPRQAERWPDTAARLAGVTASGLDDLTVHLVLEGPDGAGCPGQPKSRRRQRAAATGQGSIPEAAICAPAAEPDRHAAYLVHAPDRAALAAVLSRIADVAPWLSDGELADLACQLGREAASQGPARVAIVASRQEQLARLSSEAMTLLPELREGLLTVRPGIFAADGCDGRVTLLLSGGRGEAAAGRPDQAGLTDALATVMAALRWLEELGVGPCAAVGDGVGWLAGLAWAGCLTEQNAMELGMAVAAAPRGRRDDAPARLRAAAERMTLHAPHRRLIAASTAAELASARDIAEILAAGLDQPAMLDQALKAGAVGASLLLETGPGTDLVSAAAAACRVPAVSLDAGLGADRDTARAAAALFAVGALTRPDYLFGDEHSRPIDIWRQQIFITSPCQAVPPAGEPAADEVPAGTATAEAPAATAAEAVMPAEAQPPAEPAAQDTGPEAAEEASVEAEPPAAQAPAEPTEADGGLQPVGETVLAASAAPDWARCYATELREPAQPVLPADDRPWRVHAGGCEPLAKEIRKLFGHQPDAGRTLAVLGPVADRRTLRSAIRAVGDGISTGQLVVVSLGPGLSGLWACLHAEHPSMGITVIHAPATIGGIRTARAMAAVAPGEFRELVAGADGRLREAAMVPVPAQGGGRFPLGADDVALISRDAGAAGVALAQVLACAGASVVIIGRDRTGHDDQPAVTLGQLESSGAAIGCEPVDLADAAALAAAVDRIEQRFGPVTAIGHGLGPMPRTPVAELSEAALVAHQREGTAGLANLLGAIEPDRLRFIVTFGSVVARHGLAGEGALALASAALAERGQQLAASFGCRALHVDWPGWSGDDLDRGPGLAAALERAGIAPLTVAAGSRLLLKLLATPELPGQLTVHGRTGPAAPQARAVTAGSRVFAGRFCEQVLVNNPGVEVICQARLTLRADPYLADYRIHDLPVFPVAMAWEAMAQAASALAGEPMREMTEVAVNAPVVVPAGMADASALIRIRARREAGAVTVTLHSEQSNFAVDHFRAVFRASTGRDDRGADAGIAAEPAGGPAGGAVDASDLYAQVFFQAGRFRRITGLRSVTSGSCTAIAQGADDRRWFEPAAPEARQLTLGSPGMTDAMLQAVQACVPHRLLLPIGCESAVFSGRSSQGSVQIRATEVTGDTASAGATARSAAGRDPGQGQPVVPRQRASGPGETAQASSGSVWDVAAFDEAGQQVAALRRLRCRDGGPLLRVGPWPAPLLAAYLERSAAALGLAADVRVRIGPRRPAGRDASPARPGRRWTVAGPGGGQLAALRLQVIAGGPAACAWRAVRASAGEQGNQPALRAVAGDLAGLGEPPETAAARARAVTACLPPPARTREDVISSARDAGDGWLVLSAGQATLACVVTAVAGIEAPVAIAVMTGSVAPRRSTPRPARASTRPRTVTGKPR